LQEQAKKSLTALEPRIPWLQLDIVGPEEDVIVKIDGKQVDASSEIPLNPGSHKITILAEGYETTKKKVELEEGVHQKKKIKLKKGEGKSSDEDEEGDGGSGGHSKSGGDSGPSIFSPSHPKFPAVATIGGGALVFLPIAIGTGAAAIGDSNE